MNARVQKLEALLERIQRNRDKPRSGSSASAPFAAPLAAPAAERAAPRAAPASRAPVAAVERPSVRSFRPRPEKKRAPRVEKPAQPEPAVEQPPLHPEPASQPAAPKRVRAARVTPGKPFRVSPAELTKAAGAVASVVSPHSDPEPVTFGELLRRSLSLRPR